MELRGPKAKGTRERRRYINYRKVKVATNHQKKQPVEKAGRDEQEGQAHSLQSAEQAYYGSRPGMYIR